MTAWKRTSTTTVREIDDRLVAFEGADPKSSRGKRHYCYVLRTARGNVMVHSPDAATFVATCGDGLDSLGGVQWIFLTHHGDATTRTCGGLPSVGDRDCSCTKPTSTSP